jgi:hypothetical protein
LNWEGLIFTPKITYDMLFENRNPPLPISPREDLVAFWIGIGSLTRRSIGFRNTNSTSRSVIDHSCGLFTSAFDNSRGILWPRRATRLRQVDPTRLFSVDTHDRRRGLSGEKEKSNIFKITSEFYPPYEWDMPDAFQVRCRYGIYPFPSATRSHSPYP